MARKSNRVRIYKPPKSRRGWKYSKGKKPKKRKQVVLESKMIQRHTTGQISNEISPSWTQTQSERDTRTMLGTVDHMDHGPTTHYPQKGSFNDWTTIYDWSTMCSPCRNWLNNSGFDQILSVVKIRHHSAFGTRYFLPRGNLPRVFRGGFSKSIQSYDWTRWQLCFDKNDSLYKLFQYVTYYSWWYVSQLTTRKCKHVSDGFEKMLMTTIDDEYRWQICPLF